MATKQIGGAAQALDNDLQTTLPFSELNNTATDTILFIHGAFVDRNDWDLVTPHFSKYHILLPDLPSHGQAERIGPFSKQLSARLLADLIRQHAKGGRAHLVALSLGAFVAIELASVHCDVVNEMFISGLKVMPVAYRTGIAPYGLWLSQRLESYVPLPLVRWAMDGTDMQGVDLSRVTLPLCRAIMSTITAESGDGEWAKPWSARTCIISAGKAGIVPSADHPEDAVKYRDIGRKGNAETVAFMHHLMRHPWNRQDPGLFARAARCWFERESLPAGFVEL
ncbi:hypothetical protein LTR12_014930 [Friedmanniomyces endolithicus]|nr:hypothetical protein LTR12_014930 [Friedmanniomyces endolithicus]